MRRRLIILIPALLALGLPAVSAEEPKRAESFTVVLLPDTQNYSENFPDNYVAQTLWIRKRLKDENIQFAIHLGDIVQNATQETEWENADRAMRILDGVVPYSMVPDNHDMVINVENRDASLYNKYFSTTRFAGLKWYGGPWAMPMTTITAFLKRAD